MKIATFNINDINKRLSNLSDWLKAAGPDVDGTLEAALKAGRFPVQAEALRLYRSIATMDAKAPLPTLRDQNPTWGNAAALARRWGLKALADRFDSLLPTESGSSH